MFTDTELKIAELLGSASLYIITLAGFVKYILPKMLDTFTTALDNQRKDFLKALNDVDTSMVTEIRRLTRSVERQTKVIIFSNKNDKPRTQDALESLIADKDDLANMG